MASQIVFQLVLLISQILGNDHRNIFDLLFKFLLFLQIVLCFPFNNLLISAFLYFHGLFPLLHQPFACKFSCNFLYMVALPTDHFFQILEKVIERGKIFFISGFVFSAQLQNDLQSLLLKQTFTKLIDNFLLFLGQLFKLFASSRLLITFLVCHAFFG